MSQIYKSSSSSPPSGLTSVAAFSFTYNLTTASGTQNFTGLSFTPKAIVSVNTNLNNLVLASFSGCDDGTHHVCTSINSGNDYQVPQTSVSLYAGESTSALQTGYVSAFLSDGFTITWTKTGSPTGTITIQGLAIG